LLTLGKEEMAQVRTVSRVGQQVLDPLGSPPILNPAAQINVAENPLASLAAGNRGTTQRRRVVVIEPEQPAFQPEAFEEETTAVPAATAHAAPHVVSKAACERVCPGTPWPAILLAALVVISVIYILVIPVMSFQRRLIVGVISLLWGLLWALIVWWAWRSCRPTTAWICFVVALAINFFFTIGMIYYLLHRP
jgi:hypothetical protein